MTSNPDLPPLPRDHARSSFSEIVPLRSGRIDVLRSGVLIPGLATVAAALLAWDALYATFEDASGEGYRSFVYTLGGYLLFITGWAVWFYSRSRKPFWTLLAPALATYYLLTTQAWTLVATVFRKVLPGGRIGESEDWAAMSFLDLFTGMFFAAGLCEEVFKQIPVAAAILLGLYLARQPGGDGGALSSLAVRTPLDGLLFGMASGAGFIANESFIDYYDMIYDLTMEATGDASLAQLNAVMLMVPRTLSNLSGHMGFAGIAGYFLGLAVVRRSSAIPLVVVGLVVPSVLHALWNAESASPVPLGTAVAVATLLLFVACLLKARQLEPLFTGGAMASGGSILVGESLPRSALVPGTSARRIEREIAGADPASPLARAAAQAAVPAARRGDAGPRAPFRLRVGDWSVLLAPGASFDFRAEPGLAGAGVAGEVALHPRDPGVSGLRNPGPESWTVVTPAGETQSVPPGRHVRLVPGLRIRFGRGVEGRIEARA